MQSEKQKKGGGGYSLIGFGEKGANKPPLITWYFSSKTLFKKTQDNLINTIKNKYDKKRNPFFSPQVECSILILV